MPKTASAAKALRQSHKRRARNLKKKIELKSSLKAFKKSLEIKDQEKAKELLRQLSKKADKAAKTFLPKNKAARLKARAARRFNKVFTKK